MPDPHDAREELEDIIMEAWKGDETMDAVRAVRAAHAILAAGWTPPASASGAQQAARCAGCDLPYADLGFADLVVPDDAWKRLTGGKDGLYCPTCMVRLAVDSGVSCEATFRSGPFATTPVVPSEPASGSQQVPGVKEAAANVADIEIAALTASLAFRDELIAELREALAWVGRQPMRTTLEALGTAEDEIASAEMAWLDSKPAHYNRTMAAARAAIGTAQKLAPDLLLEEPPLLARAGTMTRGESAEYVTAALAERDAVIAEATRALVWIAHTYTDDNRGGAKCLPASDYQRRARAALARIDAMKGGE